MKKLTYSLVKVLSGEIISNKECPKTNGLPFSFSLCVVYKGFIMFSTNQKGPANTQLTCDYKKKIKIASRRRKRN